MAAPLVPSTASWAPSAPKEAPPEAVDAHETDHGHANDHQHAPLSSPSNYDRVSRQSQRSLIAKYLRHPRELLSLLQNTKELKSILSRPTRDASKLALLYVMSAVQRSSMHSLGLTTHDARLTGAARDLFRPTPELEAALAGLTPSITESINEVSATEGFKKLSDAEKAQLSRRISTSTGLSKSVRRELRVALNEEAFVNGSPDDQLAALKTFISTERGIPSTVGLDMPEPGPAQYELGPPTPIVNHPFQSKPSDANKILVNVRGKVVPVYVAKTHVLKQATIDEVARGLASLPNASLQLVNSVTIEPERNPDDELFQRLYGRPDFRGYMTAGSAGDIRIFPTVYPTQQAYLNGSLIHETGHTLSRRRFGEYGTEAKWAEWRAAAEKDGLHCSEYAKASQEEDFAETLELYQLSKGTPQEADTRRLFPERYKIIDELLRAMPS